MGISGLIACMQLPLNVSPVSASFIGLKRLGIHLVLCLACSLLGDSLVMCPPHSLSSGGLARRPDSPEDEPAFVVCAVIDVCDCRS